MRGYGLLGQHTKIVSDANDKHRKDNIWEIVGWLGYNWYQIAMVPEDKYYPCEECNSRVCGEHPCTCSRTRVIFSTTRDNMKLISRIDSTLAQ